MLEGGVSAVGARIGKWVVPLIAPLVLAGLGVIVWPAIRDRVDPTEQSVFLGKICLESELPYGRYASAVGLSKAPAWFQAHPATLGLRVNVDFVARGYAGSTFKVLAELHDARTGRSVHQIGSGVVHRVDRPIHPSADRVARVPGVWVEQPTAPGSYLFRVVVNDTGRQRLAAEDSSEFDVDRHGAVRIAHLCTSTPAAGA